MLRYLLLLALLAPLFLFGQSYDAALGLRLGTDWGLTAQLRLPQVQKNFVAEAIIQSSLRRDEGSFTVLGKQHRPLLSRRLNLFYGAGAHFGWSNELDDKTGESVGGPLGIDGVVGLEATFSQFNLSYDVKPALNLSGGNGFLDLQTAVSIRYVIAKRNDIWDKKKERQNRRDKNKRKRTRNKEKRQQEREESGKKWYEVWKNGENGR